MGRSSISNSKLFVYRRVCNVWLWTFRRCTVVQAFYQCIPLHSAAGLTSSSGVPRQFWRPHGWVGAELVSTEVHFHDPDHPWCWNIYLHRNPINDPNVGKYTIHGSSGWGSGKIGPFVQLLVICPPINRGNWKSTKNRASIVKSPLNSVSSIAMFDYRRKCLHLRSFFSTLAEVYLRSHSAHCSSPASSFVDTTTELKSAKKGPQHLCGVYNDGL